MVTSLLLLITHLGVGRSGDPAWIHYCDRYTGRKDSGDWIREEYIAWQRRNMDAANMKADFLYRHIRTWIFMPQLEN